jgi:hypothetical protein
MPSVKLPSQDYTGPTGWPAILCWRQLYMPAGPTVILSADCLRAATITYRSRNGIRVRPPTVMRW